MDIAEIHRRVVALVHEIVPGAKDADDAVPLVLLGEDGVFDSVTALELILALEKEFGIVVKDDEIQPGNLANVDSIARFVQGALTHQTK
jgi:acyl carrier protein